MDAPNNVAPPARVTGSSAHPGGLDGDKAVDGIAPAYGRPMGDKENEGGSDGDGGGGWPELDWTKPVYVDRVRLLDRANATVRVPGGP